MSHASRLVRVLCRPEVAAGFAVAGLAPLESPTAPEGAARLRELLEDSTVGVVLIEEGFYDQLPEDLRHRLGRRPLPMVVPFPGPVWQDRAEGPEAYIVELLRQVIGYRVKLK